MTGFISARRRASASHAQTWAVLAAALVAAACAPEGDAPTGNADAGDATTQPELSGRLAALEQRKTRLEDVGAIERLQHAYGYYVDEGLWDEAADLFAADGTIEYGLDGVYAGRERVREYLYAFGDGRRGLGDGVLNEHLQIMPVITLAADGLSAQGRWRAIVLGGELGESAYWAEGPYENTYVKEDGVWQIESLHWFQTVAVPYEGGWQGEADLNGGVWVSAELPPDAPPTVRYTTWPEPYVPPYHFPNPVATYTGEASTVAAGGTSPGPGHAPADEPAAAAATGTQAARTAAAAAAQSAPADAASAAAVAQTAFDATLAPAEAAARTVALEQEIALLEAEREIENLQRIYGYYVDKQFWSAAAALFAANGTLESGASGVYVGPERIRDYLALAGPETPQPGRLYDRMQLQPIVTVDPSLERARGRWHLFAQEAVSGEYGRWGLGVYENEYVRENGVWKIAALHLYPTMYTPYADGWGKTALPNSGPSADVPPDRPATVAYEPYPATFVVPFHYEHPVSSRRSASAVAAEPVADLAQRLDGLEQRLTRLADAAEIERLHAVYGYYLADKSWDDLAGIFAPDGTIEIAMRGVYVGQPSVRRNLDLYNEEGTDLLHNHMQFQPVIHVADDGQTAHVRSRAFSMMGKFNRYAQWMGGIYENDFVKIDGVWRIKKDHQINTYFAPYAVGWKDLQARPPPAVNPNNPPDLPPSETFVMYPGAYLPAYHYPHPVTGETVTWQPPTENPDE